MDLIGAGVDGMDLISSLDRRQLRGVVEQIWRDLDWKSLKTVTEIERWNNLTSDDSFWQDLFLKNSRVNVTWLGLSLTMFIELNQMNKGRDENQNEEPSAVPGRAPATSPGAPPLAASSPGAAPDGAALAPVPLAPTPFPSATDDPLFHLKLQLLEYESALSRSNSPRSISPLSSYSPCDTSSVSLPTTPVSLNSSPAPSSPTFRQLFIDTAQRVETFEQLWSGFTLPRPLPQPVPTCCVQSIVHAPKAGVIGAGFHDGVVRLWNSSTLVELPPLRIGYRPVFTMASWREYVVTGDGAGTISLWRLKPGGVGATGGGVRDGFCVGTLGPEDNPPRRPVASVKLPVGPVCFLKVRGDLLVASNYLGQMGVWRLRETAAPAGSWSDPESAPSIERIFYESLGHWELDLDVSESTIVVASADTIRIWSLVDKQFRQVCPRDGEVKVQNEPAEADRAVVLVEDVVVLGNENGDFKILDVASGRRIAETSRLRKALSLDTESVVKLELVGRQLLVAFYDDGSVVAFDAVGALVARRDGGNGVTDLTEHFAGAMKSIRICNAEKIDFSEEKIVFASKGATPQLFVVEGEAEDCEVRR